MQTAGSRGVYTGLVGKNRNIWAAQVRVCGKPCLDLESVLFRRVEINRGDGGVALWVFVRFDTLTNVKGGARTKTVL